MNSLTGASRLSAQYSLARVNGVERTDLHNHPINTNKFFSETVISKGLPISVWLRILSDLQPALSYHLVYWDFWIRQRPKNPDKLTGYYDRLLKVVEKDGQPFPAFSL